MTWDPEFCGRYLTLSNDNRRVTKTPGGDGWNAGMLGSVACEKCSVRVDIVGDACNVMIGFARKRKFQVNDCDRNETCGWFLYLEN